MLSINTRCTISWTLQPLNVVQLFIVFGGLQQVYVVHVLGNLWSSV